jgi:multiple sugar transport system substrate-binding protein
VKYGANNLKSKYIPACWNAVSFKGDVYGLPQNGNTVALMYNKDMLDKTGKKAPATYNDLVSVGQSMLATSPGKTPFTAPFFENSSTGRLNWSAFEYFFWLWRNGGDILNSDYTQATFNSTAGVEALNMLTDLVKKGITPGNKYMESDFYFGNVGMIEMGNWSLPQLERQDSNANFSVAMLPKLKSSVPNYSGLGLFAMGITDSSQYPEIAFDFLAKYTTTTEYQLQYCKQNNELPVTYAALNDPYYKSANWQIYIAQYKLSKSRPGVACWDQVEKEIANAVTSAVKGQKSAKAALDAAAATVDKLLAKEAK